jgi:hypothetical protein
MGNSQDKKEKREKKGCALETGRFNLAAACPGNYTISRN